MNIVMIGTGNVSSVLGRKFRAAGHHILQVFGRNAQAASALAYEWDTESTNYKSLVSQDGDIYMIAVPDDAIHDVIRDLHLPGKVVAHTAAAVPMEILESVTEHVGVFYPLQSLRKELAYLPDIPIYVEGKTAKASRALNRLAASVAGAGVSQSGMDQRLKLHVAAVVVSNFTNHLYALAEEYCRKEGIPFTQLQPLIEETARRVADIPPSRSQTGPATRHDSETIRKHLELLESHPRLKKMYEFMTVSIGGN